MMTRLDEYTRQSLAIQVERQLTATQVLAVLERAMARYGVPVSYTHLTLPTILRV